MINRRSLIKGLTSTAITGCASLLPLVVGCADDNSITLNVVLHGLYILNIGESGIELLTPRVDDHIYRVGSWDSRLLDCLQEKYTYELSGVDIIRDAPDLDHDCNISFSQKEFGFTVNRDISHCFVKLPFPREIRYLRCIRDGDNEIHEGKPTLVKLRTFALCQALIYPVKEPSSLKLSGTRWTPDINQKLRTANLHFWAEPDHKLTPGHAARAYASLSKLTYPLIFNLDTDKTAPLDRYTGVAGVSPEEEQGWVEWQSGGDTSHPTNCNVVSATL